MSESKNIVVDDAMLERAWIAASSACVSVIDGEHRYVAPLSPSDWYAALKPAIEAVLASRPSGLNEQSGNSGHLQGDAVDGLSQRLKKSSAVLLDTSMMTTQFPAWLCDELEKAATLHDECVAALAARQPVAGLQSGTDHEVLTDFVRICRENAPVGQWPGERVCIAVERLMSNQKPARFIAESEMAAERSHNGRGGDEDRMLSGPRRPGPPAPAAVPVDVRRDSERLDFLDQMNATLNARHGTNYGWQLILSPQIVRLMAGTHAGGYVGDIDLNDSHGGNAKLPSCRAAIDAAMPVTHPQPAEAKDGDA